MPVDSFLCCLPISEIFFAKFREVENFCGTRLATLFDCGPLIVRADAYDCGPLIMGRICITHRCIRYILPRYAIYYLDTLYITSMRYILPRYAIYYLNTLYITSMRYILPRYAIYYLDTRYII